MQYLKTYLEKLVQKGNVDLADSIATTAVDIGEKYLKTFSFTTHEIGLLLGNVQSGKTGHMFGVICKATDLGFPVFIILTTDNVVLQQQTLSRVKSELEGFCICGEYDAGLFAENSLILPTIIVLKKNPRILKLWANIINSTGFMKGNPLFILDDEADAASLNTKVNQNSQSVINKYLDSIKNGATSSLYLQVTGTPQALYLQTQASGWHPLFTYYFAPGKTYLGGDFFFSTSSKPDCITFVNSLRHPDRAVVIRHLLVSAQLFLTGYSVSNCLIHPSVRQEVHKKYAQNIQKELDWCTENLNDAFKRELRKEYDHLTPANKPLESFNDIFATIQSLLNEKNYKILTMNAKSDVESSEYSSGCNFIVGGNTLGRGITFPRLQTLYYTRASKQPQADTMWQHSRMFGYDRDPGLMMVYIEQGLYKLFSDINATNNSIITQVEQGLKDIKVYYPKGLNPTRKNVQDKKYVASIVGGANYYPFYPDNDSIEDISKLLKDFSEKEAYYQVSARLITEILSHIISKQDFRPDAYISIIKSMLAETPTLQAILLVRRHRDVAQGTGALLSPNDWKIGRDFPKNIVLTMYQVTGTKGWDGKELWIPNIKLPEDTIYYDVAEE